MSRCSPAQALVCSNNVMSWVDGYVFGDDFEDLRSDPDAAATFTAELKHELKPGHPLHGLPCTVIGRAYPQDDIIVEVASGAAVVHLTWKGDQEMPPWPSTSFAASAEELDALLTDRY